MSKAKRSSLEKKAPNGTAKERVALELLGTLPREKQGIIERVFRLEQEQELQERERGELFVQALKSLLKLVEHYEKPSRSEPGKKIKVLILAANPEGTTKLSLDEECREIAVKIRAAKHRERVAVVSAWAVRADDLIQLLNEHRPHIVHFSGHGSASEEIIFVDKNGEPKPVGKKVLVNLFRTLRDNVRVVVLNACYSRPQAKAITEIIDCAIGMKRAIGDVAAITFAASFFRAIAFGRSVQEAFDQGSVALGLEGIPEESTPTLLVRKGTTASQIVLVNPR